MTTWQDIQTKTNDRIVAWAAAQSWAKDMAGCQQDSEWHAEGDVWTHTKMVCEELTKLAEWNELPRGDQLILLFTGLLHDSAKPATSCVDPETGHLRSPKHAVKGEHLARRILRELQCDVPTRERIARMVRFHGRPVFLMERTKPEHEVVRMSWLADNRLLHLFALSDMRGRTTDCSTRTEDDLTMWRMTAEENQCYGAPYPFANDHARFMFYRQQQPSLHYTPHEDYRCTATMMSGYPGSGKDTWLAQHRPDLPVVALDDIRAEIGAPPTGNQGAVLQLAKKRCQQHMRADRDFAFSATNLTRQVRSKWIDLFADYRARIEIVYVEPPMATVLQQNKKRERNVPTDVIQSLADRTEPPTLTEAHDVIIPDLT